MSMEKCTKTLYIQADSYEYQNILPNTTQHYSRMLLKSRTFHPNPSYSQRWYSRPMADGEF